MKYLHLLQPPVIHSDLKCENILISDKLVAKVSHHCSVHFMTDLAIVFKKFLKNLYTLTSFVNLNCVVCRRFSYCFFLNFYVLTSFIELKESLVNRFSIISVSVQHCHKSDQKKSSP